MNTEEIQKPMTRKERKEMKKKQSKKKNDKRSLRNKIEEREENDKIEKEIVQQDEKINNLQHSQLASESYIPVQGVSTEQQCDEYMEDQSQQMSTAEYVNYVPLNSQSVYQEPQQSRKLLISDYAKTQQEEQDQEIIPMQTEFDDGEVILQPQTGDFVQQTTNDEQQATEMKKQKRHRIKKYLRKMKIKKHQNKT